MRSREGVVRRATQGKKKIDDQALLPQTQNVIRQNFTKSPSRRIRKVRKGVCKPQVNGGIFIVVATALVLALVSAIWLLTELEGAFLPTRLHYISQGNTIHPKSVRLSVLHETDWKIKQGNFADPDVPITFSQHFSVWSHFESPPPLGPVEKHDKTVPDWGGLDIFLLEEDGIARVIYHEEWEDVGEVRDYSKRDDDVDQYYAFDDDILRSSYIAYEDNILQEQSTCRRVSWHTLHFPNCNKFHEMDASINVPKYLSYGAYRDVFVHTRENLGETENVIWKQILFSEESYNFGYDTYEFVRMDALVSERLTFSDRIVDIYGHCGQTILSEFLPSGDLDSLAVPTGGYIKQADLNDKDDVKPQNNLVAGDKLLLALEMAESIALLHGFRDGVIVHDDIQMSQFLYTTEGYIKLNDFNRAEIMLYDDEKEEYCKYRNGNGHGNYRAPEEYWNKPLNEKIDVYSFGNNMYALLTGLWPFYDETDSGKKAKDRLKLGEKPFIDARYRHRSYSEGLLVELIEKCWAYKPDERPSIFDIIKILRPAADRVEIELQKEVNNQKGKVHRQRGA